METQTGESAMNLTDSNCKLEIRMAEEKDMLLYFEWANDPEVRKVSFYPDAIDLQTHEKWFGNQLKSDSSLLFIYELDDIPVGQVRIERGPLNIISISIDAGFRGKGYGALMLHMAYTEFRKVSGETITAYIRKDNAVSIKAFTRAGYILQEDSVINGITCFTLIRE